MLSPSPEYTLLFISANYTPIDNNIFERSEKRDYASQQSQPHTAPPTREYHKRKLQYSITILDNTLSMSVRSNHLLTVFVILLL